MKKSNIERRVENILTAHDHDLLVKMSTDMMWMKRNQWFLFLLILTVEGLKLAGVTF